jgi:hypothetical protein
MDLIRTVLAALIVSVLEVGPALAGCSCSCVDGRVQASCSSSYDIKPICPAMPCATPSVRGITPVGPPSAGAHACREQQVCDSFRRCEWKQMCR